VKQPLETTGLTIQVRVGDLAAGRAWYTRLLGRPPDLDHADDASASGASGNIKAWELQPNCWLQLAPGVPAAGFGPLRLGVRDIEEARSRVAEALGIAISPIRRIEGVAAWCDFADPFGNRLGLVQDLADLTTLM
jgi:catechol 2,3-dioxygenase-like lactoylglutathione lyase family enzyme